MLGSKNSDIEDRNFKINALENEIFVLKKEIKDSEASLKLTQNNYDDLNDK